MTRVSGADLYDAIAAAKEPHHDTLYCNEQQRSALEREATKGVLNTTLSRSSSIENVAGLRVETFNQIERPIVCQKGDVFTLAKDFKYSEHEE